MSSVHRDPAGRSPYWYCAFYDQASRRRFKSTKATNKKQAQTICQLWDKAAQHAKVGRLTIDEAREAITRGIADVLAAGGHTLPSATIHQWCVQWLKAKELELQPSAHDRYSLAIQTFLGALGPDADKKLPYLTSTMVQKFRDDTAAKLSVGTVNTHLRVLRSCLYDARRIDLIEHNPAAKVRSIKEAKGTEKKKRPFTLEEIRRLLAQCGESEWRGAVLLGAYCGQRLQDCARITWGQVNVQKRCVAFLTQKTGARLEMHMAAPLLHYMAGLKPAGPGDPVFPTLAAMSSASQLSNNFAMRVMIPAGLMPARNPDKKSEGKGRSGRRRFNETSFHSLRYTFTSWLKKFGASNAMAEMIVGHSSPAVSRHYTRLSFADTVGPIAKLPDVTK